MLKPLLPKTTNDINTTPPLNDSLIYASRADLMFLVDEFSKYFQPSSKDLKSVLFSNFSPFTDGVSLRVHP